MPKVRAYGADATLLAARETTYGVLPLSRLAQPRLQVDRPVVEPAARRRSAARPRPQHPGPLPRPGHRRGPARDPARPAGHRLLADRPVRRSRHRRGPRRRAASPSPPSRRRTARSPSTASPGRSSPARPPATRRDRRHAGCDADQCAAALNGSASPQVSAATYANSGGTTLTVTRHRRPGRQRLHARGLGHSNGTVSAATLRGGGHRHEWDSGGDAIPSYTFEIGHPQL